MSECSTMFGCSKYFRPCFAHYFFSPFFSFFPPSPLVLSSLIYPPFLPSYSSPPSLTYSQVFCCQCRVLMLCTSSVLVSVFRCLLVTAITMTSLSTHFESITRRWLKFLEQGLLTLSNFFSSFWPKHFIYYGMALKICGPSCHGLKQWNVTCKIAT